ncbi:MAG: RdgB/HAM1 family non-canonical purine NTP pyrophosphatase [Chitinophagaceae bacterium]
MEFVKTSIPSVTMELIFATNNQHKAEEINSLLPEGFTIITLKQAGIQIDIPEPFYTLEANACEKASVIYTYTAKNCFGEDTGLEVRALNGAPGVKSARYAGEERSDELNRSKLLHSLKAHDDRSAQFRTVICLLLNGVEHLFEGVCTGQIAREPRGDRGFGYDPVFIPSGATKTFAEMDMTKKNTFSHRGKAVSKLVAFLNHSSVNK